MPCMRVESGIPVETGLLRSHPATGLRLRLLDEQAWPAARVEVRPDEWAASDAELAGEYTRAQRALQLDPSF